MPHCSHRSESSHRKNIAKRITTTGELLLDGSIIELIRDAESGGLRFLLCAGADRRAVDEVQFRGQSYEVPELGSSLARAVPLPTSSSAYGSTQDLFAATLNSFSLYGMPPEAARVCTYFSFATWCRSSTEPPPVLTISGPPAEAMILQQLLACVVRRGLAVVELTSASFAILEQLQPTLFIDARHFGGHGRTLLCGSCRPAAYVLRGKDAIDLAVPKVIYVGAAPDPKLSLDFALHIHLSPSTDGNRPLTSRELRQLRSEFQPRFLEYRIRSLDRVPDCDFDVPELPGESRVIARVLGACIVDDSALQVGVRALLEDHETELRERRFTDRTLVVIEVLLARCHDPEINAVRVKELTEDTNAILKARGEPAQLEPRAVGAILENLRVPREPRNSKGRRILLNASTKRWIHTLARDYRVESIEQQVPICPLCKEILRSDGDPKLKIVAEAQ